MRSLREATGQPWSKSERAFECHVRHCATRHWGNRRLRRLCLGLITCCLLLEPGKAGPNEARPSRGYESKIDFTHLTDLDVTARLLLVGSIVPDRQPTFWELYKQYVLGGLLLVLTQTMLILGLLWQRERKRKVEASLVARNIELKKSAAVLRESEERLCVAAEVGRMYAWEWDPATDSVSRSAEWGNILGLGDAGGSTAKDYFSLIHPDDVDKLWGVVNAMTPEDPTYRTQYRRFRTDGVLMWLEEAGRATFDGDGKLVRLVGMTADITESKVAKQALLESERLKGSLLGSTPSNVAVIDRDGFILEMNENWLDLAKGNGVPPQLAVEIGVNYLDRCLKAGAEDEDIMESYNGMVSVLNQPRKQFEIEYPCHSVSGQRWFRMSVTGLDGPRGGALIRHLDITQQKLAEIALTRMQEEMARMNRAAEIGQLGASLAHELAQPLAAILNNAQAAERLAKSPDPDLAEVQAALRDIIEDDQRARAVLDSVRTILKRHTVTPHIVNLNEIVEDVTKLVRHNAHLRGVQLRSTLHPKAVLVRGDEVPLQQVLLNLVNNAIDEVSQLPAERRILMVRTSILTLNNSGLLAVEDEGFGVPQELKAKLFTPFFTTKKEGLGMGLAICRTIVESLGGSIDCQNRLERGAVFRVVLPLA
jgi:two-component system, LuxR family, sensor kinase FixL